MLYILGWYWEMCGPDPIANVETDAWARLKGIRPTWFELDLLRSLDLARMKVRRELEQ